MKNTFILYREQRYKQTDRARMKSPLSPVLANLFMEVLETQSIESECLKFTFWLRYVDDMFVNWRHGTTEPYIFLNHLNSRYHATTLPKSKGHKDSGHTFTKTSTHNRQKQGIVIL